MFAYHIFVFQMFTVKRATLWSDEDIPTDTRQLTIDKSKVITLSILCYLVYSPYRACTSLFMVYIFRINKELGLCCTHLA